MLQNHPSQPSNHSWEVYYSFYGKPHELAASEQSFSVSSLLINFIKAYKCVNDIFIVYRGMG